MEDKKKKKTKKKNKKKSKTKKVILSILITILLIVAGVAGYGAYYVNNLLNKVDKVEINEENLSLNTEKQEKHTEIRNIALFGVDTEDGGTGRSDSIIILTLDSEHNKIKVTSIMRDSYVNIEGHGMDKINHAYAFGGPELAVKTLNQNFDLNIKEYMTVNFTSLPIIIDKLGGVSIEITDEEVPFIQGISSAGTYNLTGSQALAYSRIRYATGGDYKRTERQRTVVNALFNSIKAISVSQYPSLIGEFLPLVTTNMSSSELLSIGTEFAGLLSNGLQQNRYPKDEQGQGQTIDGVYYLTFDIETVKNDIDSYIFEDQ